MRLPHASKIVALIAIVQSQLAVKIMGRIGKIAMPEIIPTAWSILIQKNAIAADTVIVFDIPAICATTTTTANGRKASRRF